MEEIAAASAAVKLGSAVIAAVAALNVSAKEAPPARRILTDCYTRLVPKLEAIGRRLMVVVRQGTALGKGLRWVFETVMGLECE
uniref:Uncharacterized protein n=1 Tax=Cucumis sativus TaxID=3659 RepID=A0A0A0KHA8_CUCSA